jgi:hypothetical protein
MSPPTDAARFWGKVDQSGDCWLWTGARARRRRQGGSEVQVHVENGRAGLHMAAIKRGMIPREN